MPILFRRFLASAQYALTIVALIDLSACSDNMAPEVQAPNCDQCTYLDAWEQGPYPVGVRNDLWIDQEREALAWTGCGHQNCPRPLPVSIWYPATDKSEALPMATFNTFFSVTEAELQAVIDELTDDLGADDVDIQIPDDKNFLSRIGASIRPGSWPVIIFSHGAGGVRFQNLFQVEYLASHGYIVVSPDHEGDATVTEIDGELVTVSVDSFIESGMNRPQDVAFLMDEITRRNRNPEDFLYQRAEIGLGFGLTGHSFGSFTSISISTLDDRVAATVPMAAPGISGFGEPVPTLFMVATEDDTIDAELNETIRWEYQIADQPKMLLELFDAGHYTFSNMCDLFPEFGDGCGTGERITNDEPITYIDPEIAFRTINGYTTAWFGLHVKNNDQYARDLLNDPNKPKNDINYALSGTNHIIQKYYLSR